MAVGVLALGSTGFLDQDAKAALAPPCGKLDKGVAAELYWKPGITLVSSGEKTAIAALFACNSEAQRHTHHQSSIGTHMIASGDQLFDGGSASSRSSASPAFAFSLVCRACCCFALLVQESGDHGWHG